MKSFRKSGLNADRKSLVRGSLTWKYDGKGLRKKKKKEVLEEGHPSGILLTLPWRPRHLPPAHDMDVKMVD